MIKISNFKKSFSGKDVHKNVSFDVKKGECFGLLGGSGAGKSVILKSIIGLILPDSGEVLVQGQSISELSLSELIEVRKKVAYVFQGGALFDSMTIFDNLAYPLRAHTPLTEAEVRKKVLSLLDELGLQGNDQLLPSELSGGMQKRAGLARSIILEPKIILYDEPTAGLDPYNTLKIQEIIINLKSKGVTSIFVSHDMPSARAVCDRIALLQNGSIGAMGTIEDMEKNPNNPIKQFVEGLIYE